MRTHVDRTAARPALALLAAATVALAGCSGRSGDSSSSTSPVPSSASTSTSSESTSSPPSTSPQPAATEVNPPGDIPDDQVFVTYRPAAATFTIKVPEGWARSSAGGAVTFTDKLNSITVKSSPAVSRPTIASVQTGELPTIGQQGGNFKLGKVTLIHRKAGPVVLATYLQDSKPDPVTDKVVRDAVERYSFWSHGTEAVLTLSGPKGADNVDPWRLVSDSLTWH